MTLLHIYNIYKIVSFGHRKEGANTSRICMFLDNLHCLTSLRPWYDSNSTTERLWLGAIVCTPLIVCAQQHGQRDVMKV